jgi:iron complex outermembrane receptor protein
MPSPVASPVSAPVPAPAPTPAPAPVTPETPSAAPADAAPSPEPAAEEAKKEKADETGPSVVSTLGKAQDVTDWDITALMKVTATEDGTRTEEDEPGLVTVLTEEDIRRMGARSLREVLQTVAGVEVLTDGIGRDRIVIRGVPGALSGGSSENVLLLLNGVRLNEDVFGGATAVNLDLPVDNVKRIEVVRGPGPVVYGPGALVGVINIVTESVETFRRDELTLGGGSFKTFLYNFRYGTTFHDVSLAGFVQFTHTGGARLDVPADAQTLTDRALAPGGIRPVSLAPGRTSDDRNSVDANLTIAYRAFTLGGRFKADNGGAYIGPLDVLGGASQLQDRQVLLWGQYRRDFHVGDLRTRVTYTESHLIELFDALPPGFTLVRRPASVVFPSGVVYRGDLNSRRVGADVLLERPLGPRHALTAGASLEHASTFGLDATTNFDPVRQQPLAGIASVPALVPDADRTLGSLFVQDNWNPTTRLGVTGGLRLDRYSDFGTHVSPSLAAAYRVRRDLTLKTSYAHGVRAPSFRELFYSAPGLRANPTLGVARADSMDLTALYRRGDLRLSVTGYRAWLRDLIAPTGALGLGLSLDNVTGIDAQGVDVEASRSFGANRSVAAVYSWQRPRDSATDRRLADVPTHLGRLSVNLPAGKYLILSPSVTVRSARPRALGDARPDLKGYTLVDMVARVYNFHPALELNAVVHDLFGREYFDPSPLGGLPGDYPRPGRSVFVKAKVRF